MGCDQLPTPADWSPILAAPAQSAFIGVMAGFVFMGLVYLLTERDALHGGGTLVLFIAAFMCLAAGSYMTSLISGEVACLRAWSESMFVSGLLAVGVVAMLCGVVWLLPERHGATDSTRRFLLASVVIVAVVVVELLTTTARGFILDLPVDHGWRDRAAWLLISAPLIVISFVVRHLASGGTTEDVRKRQQKRVSLAAISMFIFVISSLAFLGVIGDRPAGLWMEPAGWVVWSSVLIPCVGSTVAISFAVWSLPTKRAWKPASTVRPVEEPASLAER